MFKNHFYDGADIEYFDVKKIKNHNFFVDDLRINNFKKNFYDIVISTNCIERLKNFKDIEKAIQKLRGNLKLEGYFITMVHHDNIYGKKILEEVQKDFFIINVIDYHGQTSLFYDKLLLKISDSKNILEKLFLTILYRLSYFLAFSLILLFGENITLYRNTHHSIIVAKKLK